MEDGLPGGQGLAAAWARWREGSRRGRWDAPRFPPLAVGSGGRTETAVRELRFVPAAARGGRGGGRREGHGPGTGRSAGSQVGKRRPGLHLAPSVRSRPGLCAHSSPGLVTPWFWTHVPPAAPPSPGASRSRCHPPKRPPPARGRTPPSPAPGTGRTVLRASAPSGPSS